LLHLPKKTQSGVKFTALIPHPCGFPLMKSMAGSYIVCLSYLDGEFRSEAAVLLYRQAVLCRGCNNVQPCCDGRSIGAVCADGRQFGFLTQVATGCIANEALLILLDVYTSPHT
jgi:hypothetical protein